jgi:hypothetical protein
MQEYAVHYEEGRCGTNCAVSGRGLKGHHHVAATTLASDTKGSCRRGTIQQHGFGHRRCERPILFHCWKIVSCVCCLETDYSLMEKRCWLDFAILNISHRKWACRGKRFALMHASLLKGFSVHRANYISLSGIGCDYTSSQWLYSHWGYAACARWFCAGLGSAVTMSPTSFHMSGSLRVWGYCDHAVHYWI